MRMGRASARPAHMQISILKPAVYHDRLGKLVKGRVVDVPDHQANEWLRRGFAERYETKVLRERPSLAVGAPLSALPAAQVSTPQTLNSSEPGKKRGRPKKNAG